MEKVKNILTIAIKSLVVIAVVLFLIFYCIAPSQTMYYIGYAFKLLDTDIGKIIISIVGGGYTLYKIIQLLPFSKTFKEKMAKELQEEKNMNKEYREEIAKKVNQLNATKDECFAIIGSYKDTLSIYEEQFLKVCETSPNAKINAIGEEYKEKKEQLEKQISDKYDLAKNSIAKKVDETTKDYNSILKELKEIKEKVYGEKTTND